MARQGENYVIGANLKASLHDNYFVFLNRHQGRRKVARAGAQDKTFPGGPLFGPLSRMLPIQRVKFLAPAFSTKPNKVYPID
jgi:hypothetical protein